MITKRRLPGSLIEIPPIILGGNIFGYSCDQKESDKIIHLAQELGLNAIDTADVYGDGSSETMIGNAIRSSNEKDNFIVLSKYGLKTGEKVRGYCKPKEISLRVEKSLSRLRRDYIDIYQLHSFDPEVCIEELCEYLSKLQDEGKIRYAGYSNFYPEDIEKFNVNLGRKLFVSNQRHYNLLKRDLEKDLINYANSKVGVFVFGVLGRGVFSSKVVDSERGFQDQSSRLHKSGSVRKDFENTVLLKTLQDLHVYITKYKAFTLSQYALLWSLRNPMVYAAILGVRTIEQLKDMHSALNKDVSPKFFLEIDEFIGEMNQYKEVHLGEVDILKMREL